MTLHTPSLRASGRAARAIVVALVAAWSSAAAVADEAAAWAALRAGGVVALMRHGDAPGAGDPPGWRLDDCTTQRNLSERGRAEARAVGARLRDARIAIDRVVSSPWCRCVETARLAAVGTVEVEPAFANAYVLADDRETLRARGLAILRTWRGRGVLLVVSHGENIRALTGENVAPAEIVVVARVADGTLRAIGSIPPR
ncbi:MAG TPA: histidine phosphatase family protein [Caldimonas sp.]|nr:histidine phosphatase family protein [Caldimonas sp.]